MNNEKVPGKNNKNLIVTVLAVVLILVLIAGLAGCFSITGDHARPALVFRFVW